MNLVMLCFTIKPAFLVYNIYKKTLSSFLTITVFHLNLQSNDYGDVWGNIL